jgi:hypothetical protein
MMLYSFRLEQLKKLSDALNFPAGKVRFKVRQAGIFINTAPKILRNSPMSGENRFQVFPYFFLTGSQG